MNSLQSFESRSYKTLTQEDWNNLLTLWIVNWCGWGWMKVKNRLIRWIISKILKRLRLVFLQASCNIHDFTYWQWWDEARRLECDMWFFIAIISDIHKIKTWISVVWYTMLALIFYYAVRIGGKSYFNYH